MPDNPTPEVYIQFRWLYDSCRPAWVVRHDGVTLVAIDPRSTREEVVCWAPDFMTTEEINVCRAAYGQPAVGRPVADEWMEPKPYPGDLPASLILPGTPTALLDRVRRTREDARRVREDGERQTNIGP